MAIAACLTGGPVGGCASKSTSAVQSGRQQAAATPDPAHHGTIAATLPTPTVQTADGVLWAWGMVEVPARSRLSAVKAMAAAVARAELGKFFETHVETVMTDVDADDDRARLAEITRESTTSVLGGGPPAAYGWQQTGDALRMVARIGVSLEALEAALATRGDKTLANRIVDGLRR